MVQTHFSHCGNSGSVLKLSAGNVLRYWTSNRPPMIKSPPLDIPFNLKRLLIWHETELFIKTAEIYWDDSKRQICRIIHIPSSVGVTLSFTLSDLSWRLSVVLFYRAGGTTWAFLQVKTSFWDSSPCHHVRNKKNLKHRANNVEVSLELRPFRGICLNWHKSLTINKANFVQIWCMISVCTCMI